jgi:hypothetical protein
VVGVRLAPAMSAPDHRDLVIAELADSEAALLDLVFDLAWDVERWRHVATHLHHLVATTVHERQQLQAALEREQDQYRYLREQTLL